MDNSCLIVSHALDDGKRITNRTGIPIVTYSTLSIRRDDRTAKSKKKGTFLFSGKSQCEEQLEDLFALYEGGERLNTRIERFLHKSPSDPQELYLRKLDAGKIQYVNYFSQVIDFHCSYLFSHPMNFQVQDGGELPEYYSNLKEDCTGTGTDFDKLLREAFKSALIGRISAVVADLPVLDSEVLSLADYEKLKAGDATLRLFSAQDIIDYELKENGALLWVTLRKKESFRASPLSEDVFTRETFWVYTDQEKSTFVFEYQGTPAKDANPQASEVISHGFKSVPVLLLNLGDSALGPKLEAPQTANWLARSKRAILTNSHANSMPVFFSGVDDISSAFSASYGLKLEQGDTIDYISPPATSLEALQEEISDTARELFKVANQIHLDGSGQTNWRSAQSRMIDQDAGHLQVRSYGATVRELAENLLNLIAQARGDSEIFRASGFEHLQTETLDELIQMADKLGLSLNSETFTQEFNKRLVSQALKDLDEGTKQKIFSELMLPAPKPEPVPTQIIETETKPEPEDQALPNVAAE